MNHIIIGAGVIGKATGEYLEARNEKVFYFDKNKEICNQLQKEGKLVTYDIKMTNLENCIDYFWICTAEWDVDTVMDIVHTEVFGPKFVIRSTISPDKAKEYITNYDLRFAHVPEFLREKTATEDIFNSDRVVIGCTCKRIENDLKRIFYGEKIITCTPIESSLIKLIANAWLAMQISFWNDMYKLIKKYHTNPQLIANAVTLDKRISKYGSAMIHKPFGGFCFPKDTKTLLQLFKDKNLEGQMINALRIVNEMIE